MSAWEVILLAAGASVLGLGLVLLHRSKPEPRRSARARLRLPRWTPNVLFSLFEAGLVGAAVTAIAVGRWAYHLPFLFAAGAGDSLRRRKQKKRAAARSELKDTIDEVLG